MKGIVLAAGKGSRLWPATKSVSKQLLTIYDKPLIYYPIATLMLAGINQILIIVNEQDLNLFSSLLGDGSNFGVDFQYRIQQEPKGIAEAFLIGESFISNEPVALILGDNIFHGKGLGTQLKNFSISSGATIFAYQVTDPERYGVVEFNSNMQAVSIEEKPKEPRSSYAIPGLYFYDSEIVNLAKELKPSSRGELEISDINTRYLNERKLMVELLPRGTTWFDAGTFNSMNDAANYVRIIEERQGYKIACLEEIAWRNKWINDEMLINLSLSYNNSFKAYLNELIKN